MPENEEKLMQAGQESVDPNKPQWLSYEERSAYLLHRMAKEFGLQSVEGKQKIQGNRSGTSWKIDAKGIMEGGKGFFIVECRRYTKSRQKQEQMGGLAYRILDTGAEGAILVSPMGFQEGAAKIAAAENIIRVLLNENCTLTDFVIQFFDKICLGISAKVTISVRVTPRLIRACSKCGKKFEVSGNENLCNECAD